MPPLLADGCQGDEQEDEEEHEDGAERNVSPTQPIENDRPDRVLGSGSRYCVHAAEPGVVCSTDGRGSVNGGT